MPRDFFPRRDADVVHWSANLAAKLVADPGAYSISAQAAADYMALHEQFALLQRRAVDPGTRTSAAIVARDEMRVKLEASARHLCGFLRALSTVSPAQRVSLGLPAKRRKPSRIARPTVAPEVTVTAVCGHRVKLRLSDPAFPLRRARPDGTRFAVLFAFVGEVPSAGEDGWACIGNLSRMHGVVSFGDSLEAGTKLWLRGVWVNARGEHGPFGPMTPVRIQFDGPMPIRMGKPIRPILRAA